MINLLGRRNKNPYNTYLITDTLLKQKLHNGLKLLKNAAILKVQNNIYLHFNVCFKKLIVVI